MSFYELNNTDRLSNNKNVGLKNQKKPFKKQKLINLSADAKINTQKIDEQNFLGNIGCLKENCFGNKLIEGYEDQDDYFGIRNYTT